MEATVNMKMTPAEHRLLREAVEEASYAAKLLADNRDEEPVIRRDARAREAQLGALLERL